MLWRRGKINIWELEYLGVGNFIQQQISVWTQILGGWEDSNFSLQGGLRRFRSTILRRGEITSFLIIKKEDLNLSFQLAEGGNLCERWNNYLAGSLLGRMSYIMGVQLLQWLRWYGAGGTIHFIRVTRHYNKRRYARVRAVSRPPFWAGGTMCSIFIGMYWGGSMEKMDWVSSQLLIIPMNYGIFLIYAYLIYQIFWTWGSANWAVDRDLQTVQRYWGVIFKKDWRRQWLRGLND